MMEEIGNSSLQHRQGNGAIIANKNYSCPVCTKECKSQQLLTMHQTKVHDDIYQCSECEETCDSKRSFLKHLKIHNFVCQTCGKQFETRSKLQRHNRGHTGERPFECQICLMRFVDNSALSKHKRIHTGERPFKCIECNKSFFRSGDLKSHCLIHSGERPFSCQFCNKSFNHNSNLHYHERRIHLKLKPHECELCYKHFAKRSYLNDHIKLHTGENLYKCQECGKELVTLGNLARHVRMVHAKNAVGESGD